MNYDKVKCHGSLLIPQKKKKNQHQQSASPRLKAAENAVAIKISKQNRGGSCHEYYNHNSGKLWDTQPLQKWWRFDGDECSCCSGNKPLKQHHPPTCFLERREEKKKKNNNMFSVRFLFVEEHFLPPERYFMSDGNVTAWAACLKVAAGSNSIQASICTPPSCLPFAKLLDNPTAPTPKSISKRN